MKIKTKLVHRAVLMSLMAAATVAQAQTAKPTVAAVPVQAAETPAQRDARMAWWREARFGMFIHWGLYAVPGGEWNGRKDLAEWFMDETGIARADYEKFAAQFNPTKYDPDEWVRIAKDAGMKYIVITSKHHEGFAMWDTKGTDYNIAKRTPYGKGVLKPLAEAARRAGLHFGTYYSIMDWHDPSQSPSQPGKHYNPTKMDPAKKRAYIEEMKAELAELVRETHTEVLWFDGEWMDWWTNEDGRELYTFLRQLDPNLIINNRVGNSRAGSLAGMDKGEGVGDFGTPEQNIPARGFGPGVYWETCMTLNDHWGYNKYDDHWKSTEVVVRNLVDIASKGGNYLLNVGPEASGVIPAPAVARLHDIGGWLKVNGESIYGTGPTPFAGDHGGYSTSEKNDDGKPKWIAKWDWRATSKKGKVYVHLFEWPGKTFHVDAGDVQAKSAYLLADTKHAPLKFTQNGKTLDVQLPEKALDPIDTVLVIETKG